MKSVMPVRFTGLWFAGLVNENKWRSWEIKNVKYIQKQSFLIKILG
mgnify:CR=1